MISFITSACFPNPSCLLPTASYINVGDDERGIHTPWHHQAVSIDHTSAPHSHPQELPGFNLWYYFGK